MTPLIDNIVFDVMILTHYHLIWQVNSVIINAMIDVTLLGTAATMPLPERALSSVLLRYDGRTILFDCGEGTQTAARKAKVSLMKTDLIALTHYHGDHIFGLPGLLQTFGCMGRTDPLYICGPEGLKTAMEPIVMLAGPLPYRIFLSRMGEGGLEFGDAVLKGFNVEHRVPCFGYEFTLPRAGKFDPKKADALQVPLHERSVLQHGENITVGTKVITPSMVMGKERKGLKVVISGDTAYSKELITHAKDADLFICDATYGEDVYSEEAKLYGHSTFSDAAKMAKKAKVKRLWLTHFSQTMERPEDYLAYAWGSFPDAVAGEDGKTITLRFEDEEDA